MRKRYHLTYTKEDIYPLFGAVGMIVIGITGVIQAGVIQEDIVCVILYSIIILIGGIWTVYVVNNILPKSLIGKQFVRLQLKEDILWMGEIRNVALRVETLTSLLTFIGRPQNPNAATDLQTIGEEIGSSFAKTLTTAGGPLSNRYKDKYKGKRPLNEHMVGVWAFYDRRAGFGRILTSKLHDFQNSLQGEIIISKSFLTYPEKKPKLCCAFLEGYIKGALETLLQNRRFSVKETLHNEPYTEDKITYTNSCRFSVTPLS